MTDGALPVARDTLVLIPAFNEEASVASVVERTIAAGFDCLVVDDGSRDATSARARSAGARVVSLPFNVGVGGALRCGFRWAVKHGYRRVIQCDADGQHPPESIEELLRTQTSSEAHLVIGSRFLEEDKYRVGIARGWLMRRMARLASRAVGSPLTDTTSGFRCISEPLLSEFAREFPAEYLGDTFEALMVAANAGYKVVEVPVNMSHRIAGVPSHRRLRAVGFTVRALLGSLLGTRFTVKSHVVGD